MCGFSGLGHRIVSVIKGTCIRTKTLTFPLWTRSRKTSLLLLDSVNELGSSDVCKVEICKRCFERINRMIGIVKSSEGAKWGVGCSRRKSAADTLVSPISFSARDRSPRDRGSSHHEVRLETKFYICHMTSNQFVPDSISVLTHPRCRRGRVVWSRRGQREFYPGGILPFSFR